MPYSVFILGVIIHYNCIPESNPPALLVYFFWLKWLAPHYCLFFEQKARPYLKSSISRLFCFIHKHFSSLKFKTSIMQCTLKAHSMNWVLQVMSTRLRNISFQYGLLYCQQSLPGGEIDGSVFMCLNCPVDSCNKETEVTGGEKFLSKFFHT